ncbi:hypothetical protein [Shouchella clausii]|uniref:hypothetical protein n=1 Tax=Shouchella clausii TaxID=79880 RepID=UPI000BA56C19|nr:hypothetical protein [Shouchella clausii]PAD46690.1 hypothetical protein CHI09_11220 [Shouchella clausii]
MKRAFISADKDVWIQVISKKSAVIVKIHEKDLPDEKNNLTVISGDMFDYFREFIKEAAEHAWGNLKPKEASSLGADYYEYYDKELDNNGYLSIKGKEIHFERPQKDHRRVYKFNKRKMESFLFDLEKLREGKRNG